jgi:hypothetical protein
MESRNRSTRGVAFRPQSPDRPKPQRGLGRKAFSPLGPVRRYSAASVGRGASEAPGGALTIARRRSPQARSASRASLRVGVTVVDPRDAADHTGLVAI